MSTAKISIRDALYEVPGPKARKKMLAATLFSLLIFIILFCFIIRQFAVTGQLNARYWLFFGKITTWKFIGRGLLATLQAAFTAGFITFLAGFMVMLGRISNYKLLRGVSTVLIEFTRGVPTLLFIYFFFLVVPQFGIKMSPLWKIAAPVAISASGVVAEVLRSGVNAVPKGQKEAAMSLGMTDFAIFIKIVFPQAIRYVIPALISELVIVVKDTTFAYVVNFPDLMQNAKVLISNYDAMLSVYLLIACIYIAINYFINKVSYLTYNRLNYKIGYQGKLKGEGKEYGTESR